MASAHSDNTTTVYGWIQNICITDKERLSKKFEDMGIYNVRHLIQFPTLLCQLTDLDLVQYDEQPFFDSLLDLAKNYPDSEKRNISGDTNQTIQQWLTDEVQIKNTGLIDECVEWLSGCRITTTSDLHEFKYKFQLFAKLKLKIYEKLRLANAFYLLMKRSQKSTVIEPTMTEQESSIPQKVQSCNKLQKPHITPTEAQRLSNNNIVKPPTSTENNSDVEMVEILHPDDILKASDISQEKSRKPNLNNNETTQKEPQNNVHLTESPESDVGLGVTEDQVTSVDLDNTEGALGDPKKTQNDNESLHPIVESATSHKILKVTEVQLASNELNRVQSAKSPFVIEENENGQGVSSDIPSMTPRLPDMMQNSHLSTHPLTPGQDIPIFSPIPISPSMIAWGPPTILTTTKSPKSVGDADVPSSCKVDSAQNMNNSIQHQQTQTEWKVDVRSGVCGFDITQTGGIICCTELSGVRMLSAVGKQVSVPFDTSDIEDPWRVAVNQQTGDVIITQLFSRDWFVYIKDGAEWRQKVYSLGKEWKKWRRGPVSWTPTGQVVMVWYKDGKRHIVKYNKEDGQQVWSCPPECDYIADIAVDSRGYIYCCDWSGDCVRVYNTEGSLSHTVPRDPDTVHTLLRPWSICVDSRDRLLVVHHEKADWQPRVVTLWSSDGTYITKLLDNVRASGIRLHNDQTLVMSSGSDIRSYNISSALQAV